MTDTRKLKQAEEALEAALRSTPCVRVLAPERGFHACFEVPVTRRQVRAHGVQVNHDPGEEEAERMDTGGDYRVFVGITLREEDGGSLGIATAVDLEFFARTPARPGGEWLSATRLRDPDSGEWAQTADPASVQRLLHDACPGWNEAVRAEVVRLALVRRAGE